MTGCVGKTGPLTTRKILERVQRKDQKTGGTELGGKIKRANYLHVGKVAAKNKNVCKCVNTKDGEQLFKGETSSNEMKWRNVGWMSGKTESELN